jgi:hypothetical protein
MERNRPLAGVGRIMEPIARPSKVSTNLIIAGASGDSSRAGLAGLGLVQRDGPPLSLDKLLDSMVKSRSIT